MKFTILSLAALSLALTAFRLSAAPNSLTDQSTADFVVGIVDDEIITYSEVEEQSAPTVNALRWEVTGTELDKQIKVAKYNVIKALMDRLLILHEFKREGGNIPDSEVQKRVDERIKDMYAGDEKAFEASLAQHDETLDEYKKEIVDNLVVAYMRNKYVIERVKAMKPKNAYEEGQFKEAVQSSWIGTMYGKSYFKIFMDVP